MTYKAIRNGQCVPLKDVPLLDPAQFRQWIIDSVVKKGSRIASLFASNAEGNNGVELCAALASDTKGTIALARTFVVDSFESMAREVPQAHLFEREIAEQYGIHPEGHPWLKPVRYH
ncbi:NADH-quinone oxidoreductase subunit C, partial [bacterium]|nr:NADH-quinone oxidoreductase subunit C [bacterium]